MVLLRLRATFYLVPFTCNDVPDHVRVGVPDRRHVRVRVRIPGYPWLAVAILGYPYGRMSDTV